MSYISKSNPQKRGNDRRSIEEWYDLLSEEIHSIARSYQQLSSDEHDDIVIKTFTKVWEAEPNKQLTKGYFCTTCHNLCREKLRKHSPHRGELPPDTDEKHPRTNPYLLLEIELDMDRYFSILTEVEKAAFQLRLEGYKFKEIAEELEISCHAAKKRVYRAQEKIRNYDHNTDK